MFRLYRAAMTSGVVGIVRGAESSGLLEVQTDGNVEDFSPVAVLNTPVVPRSTTDDSIGRLMVRLSVCIS